MFGEDSPFSTPFVPPIIVAAYRKAELRMANDEYGRFVDELRVIRDKLTQDEIETLIALLYHPLTKPGTIHILMDRAM